MTGIELGRDGLLVSFLRIPCSRHDTGENDPRVRMLLGCVIGHMCNLTNENQTLEFIGFIQEILRLHDHKGGLLILARRPITEAVEEVFEQYWRLLDIWGAHGISVFSPGDEIWDDVWKMKRFSSEWSADQKH